MKAGIVDYGMGNLASVSKAVQICGVSAVVSESRSELSECDLLILPGVGNFTAGINHLVELDLAQFVKQWDKPLLGICLGMQLLFDGSEEGSSEGLGIVSGRVVRMPADVKVPHMGWNTIEPTPDSVVMAPFAEKRFYFVHSYACEPEGQVAGATTDYGGRFVSAVEAGRTTGVQFHPEKSSTDGLALLGSILQAAQ